MPDLERRIAINGAHLMGGRLTLIAGAPKSEGEVMILAKRLAKMLADLCTSVRGGNIDTGEGEAAVLEDIRTAISDAYERGWAEGVRVTTRPEYPERAAYLRSLGF